MSIYENGVDKGYRDDPNWWSNPNHPDAFRIAKLDEDYPADYFKEDHVSQEVVKKYCNFVKGWFEVLTEKKIIDIIEWGSGGGWFTEYFQNTLNLTIRAVEPTQAGYDKCVKRGIKHISMADLRNRYDDPAKGSMKRSIAICSETAEHCESFFASNVVYNIITSSDFIWWSSAEPGAPAHLHHVNEQPLKYWINLFDFYGFGCYLLPDEVFNACQGRGRCIFFNKQTYPHLL